MKYIELIEFLVTSVVEKDDLVQVKEFETGEDDFILVSVFVDNEDIGRVIGKGGKTANSIRNIVQASMYNEFKKIKIDFQSYDE